MWRALVHDISKFSKAERIGFHKTVHKFKYTTYGTNEYKGLVQKIDPSIQHHYSFNKHHPEHYKKGVNGMALIDIVEMFYDWKAAVRRHTGGGLDNSINVNKKRFGISKQLNNILKNSK
jgi:hypothetical protein